MSELLKVVNEFWGFMFIYLIFVFEIGVYM